MKKSLETFIALAAVAALIFGAFSLGKSRTDSEIQKKLTDAISQLGKLAENDAAREIEISRINAELEAERNLRKAEVAKNFELEKKNTGLLAENADYKRQIAAMPDAQIVVEIGLRVGSSNVGAVGVGSYRFGLTRAGGEKTVSIFKDAETYFTLAENRLVQIGTFEVRVKSLETSVEKEQAKTKIETDGKNEALRVAADTKFTLEKVKKDLKVSKMKHTLTGVAIGVGAAIVIRSLFVK